MAIRQFQDTTALLRAAGRRKSAASSPRYQRRSLPSALNARQHGAKRAPHFAPVSLPIPHVRNNFIRNDLAYKLCIFLLKKYFQKIGMWIATIITFTKREAGKYISQSPRTVPVGWATRTRQVIFSFFFWNDKKSMRFGSINTSATKKMVTVTLQDTILLPFFSKDTSTP